ncbi:MAG: phage tail tube protein [Evtepia gabavorous]
MGKFNSNKVIRGTFGRAWVDGALMANVKSFEAKATIDYEDLDINGDFGQKKRYMGYSIAGTMTLHKFDSYILKKYQAAIMSGDLPEMKIVASLADPQSDGTQRVALYDVHLDEITLLQFENKTVLEEEVPLPRVLNSWT